MNLLSLENITKAYTERVLLDGASFFLQEGEKVGIIGINGAAAHLIHPGDLVILIAYATMDDAEARTYQPNVIFVDAQNRQIDFSHDAAHVPDGVDGLLSPR
mgnify:CR=1 FL=1